MKGVKFFALITMMLAVLTISAYGNGILRTPGQHGDDVILPLRAIYVNVEIHDQVAITHVKDVFYIAGDQHIDANFHFRLPVSASVSGFGYWRGDEFFRYNLRPGEQGGPGTGGGQDNAALRAYLGMNPFGIFLDSIPPGDFTVELEFTELLPYDFGVVTERYPFALGNFLASDIDTLSLNVSVTSQRQMTEMECLGEHNQDTEWRLVDQYHATASLNLNDFRPQDDWRLNIRFNQEDLGGWLYTHRSDTTADGYFMLVVEPGIVDPDEQVQKFFTFVFDRSGSMAGQKMVQAKSAAITCLNRLIATDYFNVIDFASDVRLYHNGMLQASNANLNTVRNYVNQLAANGSTNIYGALTSAVQQNMGEGTANQVVFITDGQPTAGVSLESDSILAAVGRANQNNARIFCFGIGNDADSSLLNGLALGNRGQSYFINPQDARIDSVVDRFYRYIASPVLVNPLIDFGDGLEIDSLAPPELQDISAGHQLFLFGRYGNFGEYDITLEGSMPEGDTAFAFGEMEFPRQTDENQFIPRMWAKATIDYWLAWLGAHGERGNQAIIDKIIELSLRFNILTPYTEFEEPPNAITEPAIALVSAEPLGEGVLISWDPVGVKSLASYNIYRSNGPDEPFSKLNDAPLVTTSYIDRGARAASNARYMIEMMVDGRSIWSGVVEIGRIPTEIALAAPYPNPFNARVNIAFGLPSTTEIRIGIYDARGAEVATLTDGVQPAGAHSLVWDAGNQPAGIYFVRLESGSFNTSQKILLLK